MPEPVTIRVLGRPAPQGSKRAFVIRGGPRKGQAAVIESSHDRVKSWRQAVLDEARAVAGRCGMRALDGPLIVSMIFYLPRPKGHYRTGKNAHLLRDSAPAYPAGKPDTGKLARSTEDALTDAVIWRDDAQIVDSNLAKRYADGIPPGVVITIREAT
jgi:Holliday junction resolvase RusA-like endonuclease